MLEVLCDGILGLDLAWHHGISRVALACAVDSSGSLNERASVDTDDSFDTVEGRWSR